MKIEQRNMTVRELPISERPYEKCELMGPEALSDSELLAVILKNGTQGESVIDLSRRIIASCDAGGSIANLDVFSLSELKEIRGVGRVKAIQIKCAAEFGRRIASAKKRSTLDLRNARSLAEYYRFRMSHLDRETVVLLHADAKGRIFYEEHLSVGTVNCSLLSPREIFVSALKRRSVNIFLLHNHPSGDPEPSKEDFLVTERVAKAGELVGIKLLDHVIIGSESYVSFNEMGALGT